MLDPIRAESYFSVVNKISGLFACNLITRKQMDRNNKYYLIAAFSKKSIFIIIEYFKLLPLYCYKYLDYKY